MKQAPILVIVFLLIQVKTLSAQTFRRGATLHPDPSAIILEQYVMLKLSESDVNGIQMNAWDSRNPFTYMEVLGNPRGEIFHVLYQTNFTGQMTFLAVSKNLSVLLFAREKPQLGFRDCLSKINRNNSSVGIPDAALGCILRQLQLRAAY